MNAVETLLAARDLISDPLRFTQKAYARDRCGRPVRSNSTDSYCWCFLGALMFVGRDNDCAGTCAIGAAIHTAAKELFNKTVLDVNDELGHAAILAVCDRAVGLLS